MPSRLPRLTNFLATIARRLFRRQSANLRGQHTKRPIRCWIERLEPREVFNANFHGGALIPHVEAQAVFLGSQWASNTTLEAEADSINKFLGGLVQSPYMDMLTDQGDYKVGQGTYTKGAVVNTTVTGTITDATIRSLLQAAINFNISGKPAGLVQQPDLNRLYVVYTPSGVTVNNNGATSQTSFLGYHGAFAGTDFYGVPFDIHYVVVPHPGAPNATSTTNGFVGVSDAQVLTLLGTSGGTLLPTFNGVTATTPITRTDEQQTVTIGGNSNDGSFNLAYNGTAATIAAMPGNVQTLTVGGSVIGSLTLSYNGIPATPLAATNEVQKLTIGDMSDFTLSFNGASGSTATKLSQASTAADVLAHLNSISALNGNVAVTGSAGAFTITFQAALSANNVAQLVPSDPFETVTTVTEGLLSGLTAAQVQTNLNSIPALSGNVAVAGSAGGPFTITFGGSLASANVSQLVAATTGGTTASVTSLYAAANLQASLNSIPALNNNVTVTGAAGGPFTVTFANALTGVNVSQLTVQSTTGAVAPTVATSRQGVMPTAAQVQSSLNGIAALTNNVTVTGNDGGPFTIVIKNLTTIPLLDVSTVTGGLTASISQGTGPGSSADLDQLTAVTSHELAESVTDPDVNYKTLGWYDEPNNVEIADLPNAPSQIPDITTRLNGYLTSRVYDQLGNIVAPNTTSTVFPSNNAMLQNVTVQQISLTRALVSWTPVADAVGYRVLQVSNGQTTLLSRVPAMQNGNPASSTILTGLPQTGTLTLRVEAYNAANVTAPADKQLTMTLAALTAPTNVVANKIPNSITSVLLTWTGSAGAAGYRVFQVSGTTKSLRATLGEGGTSATINGLKTGTKVTFIIEAFRGSAKADSIKASVQLDALTFTVTRKVPAPGPTTVELDWSWNIANPGATGYRIYRVTSTGSRILIATRTASATFIQLSGFPANTKFVVQAVAGTKILASSGPV